MDDACSGGASECTLDEQKDVAGLASSRPQDADASGEALAHVDASAGDDSRNWDSAGEGEGSVASSGWTPARRRRRRRGEQQRDVPPPEVQTVVDALLGSGAEASAFRDRHGQWCVRTSGTLAGALVEAGLASFAT